MPARNDAAGAWGLSQQNPNLLSLRRLTGYDGRHTHQVNVSAMKSFLVDVFALHSRGQEMHLGGGLFHASSASEAEGMASEEFWIEELTDRGFEIGFRTDTPERGQQVMSLERLQAASGTALYA